MDFLKLARAGASNPTKAVRVLGRRLLSAVGTRDYKRFIVLSRSRTGSNLLIASLDSHPNISAEGEIFSTLRGRDARDLLGRTFSRQPYFVKAKGFKIFYNHPQDDAASGLWEALQAMDDLHVIHLKRRNKLRTLLSRRIAQVEDVWLVKGDRTAQAGVGPTRVTFALEELVEGFKRLQAREEHGDRMFARHRLLSLDYDDIADGNPAGLRQATEMLGVDYQPPVVALRKQNNRSMRDSITNYDELKAACAGSPWESFFED